MGRQKKQRADNRADTGRDGWIGIPRCVKKHVAYESLSLWARAVFIEIMAEFNGYNNGQIVLSVTQICERLGNSNRGKAARAIAELMEHGLIDISAEAVWKQRLARQYRLTFVSTGGVMNARPATNEYRQWTPKEKNGGNASLPVKGKSGDALLPEAPKAGYAALPAKKPKPQKSAISENAREPVSGNAVSPFIVKPSPQPKRDGVNEGNTPSNTPQISGADFSALPSATPAAMALARKIGAIQ